MRDYARLKSHLLSDLSRYSSEIQQGFVTSDMSIRTARAVSLASSFYKKLAPKGVNKAADRKALQKFLEVNDRLSKFTEPSGLSELRSAALSYFYDNCQKYLDDESGLGEWWHSNGLRFNREFARDHFRPGPGASIDANSRNFYTKMFDSPLSGTSGYVLAFYRAAIVESDTWAEAEKLRSRRFGEKIVRGNRLFFVPKNSDVSRTCCTEPAANMLLQQALGAFIEVRLKRWFHIDLSTQPDLNRRLARIGSFDLGHGLPDYATIDLSSASDSIRWSLCEKALPQYIVGYMRQFRSPRTILPDGSEVELAMVSTMGNGFTFPLQTYLFACAVRAIYDLMNIPMFLEGDEPNFSVFGDDIIVVPKAYNAVIQLLEDLGFEVNVSKSFSVGPFRESCGFDYFKGSDIRGVYIKTLETPGDVYSAFNRLTRWSAVSGISIPNTLACLKGWAKYVPIPFSRADDEGFKVPDQFKPPDICRKTGWTRYRYLADRSSQTKVPTTLEESNRLGYADYNPFGWAVAILGRYASTPDNSIYPAEALEGGSPRVNDILIGNRRPAGVPKARRYRSGIIPYWDYYDGNDIRFRPDVFHSWKAVVVSVDR